MLHTSVAHCEAQARRSVTKCLRVYVETTRTISSTDVSPLRMDSRAEA